MSGNTYDNHTGRSPVHTSSVVPVLMQNTTNMYRGMEVTLLTSAQLHTLVALFLVILDRLAVTLPFQYVFLLINISFNDRVTIYYDKAPNSTSITIRK
jgi:hypothetical protein